MKTIEEAAILNYENTDWNTYEDERIINAFKSGVEFVQRWIPVDEELPKPLVKVFVKILSVNNKEFVITAQYVPPRTVLAEDFLDSDYSDLGLEDYDKENDIFYVVEGWWEHTYEADVNYIISDKVTHWRPIELK